MVDDAWLKFARDHAEPLGKVTKLVGAVLVAPAVLYYLGLAFSLLYLLPVAGMESAGRGAANRTLVVYRDELKNPIDCEGGPRVIWKKHDGSLGRGIAPICSDKACGVITPTGSETVLLDDVQRLWVPCAIKGAKNLLETPEEAVHSKTGNAVEK